MAERIMHQHSASGATLYALLWKDDGTVRDETVPGWVPYAAVDFANYVRPLTEQGASAFYVGNSIDESVVVMRAAIYAQLGGSPAEGDTPLGVVDLANGALTLIYAASQAAETAVASVDNRLTGIALYAKVIQALARNDAGVDGDALDEINAGGGTYDNTVHSLQAIAAAGGTGGVPRNQPLDNFTFQMASSADHVSGATGLTVTAQRSLDGAAFAPCANAATELSAGFYTIDLAASDMDGDIVVLLFTASGADARSLTIKTS